MMAHSMIYILYEKQNKLCIYCKREMEYIRWDKSLKKKTSTKKYKKILLKHTQNKLRATLEHLTPTCKGGKNSKDNYAASCNECNLTKSSMTHEEFKVIVKNEHDLWFLKFNRKLESNCNLANKKTKRRVKLAMRKISELLLDHETNIEL